MKQNLCIAISAPTLRALLEFQSEHDDEIDPADLADLAIRDWLQRQRELAKPAGQRGYFWKKLFLPEGTRLRVSNHMTTRYAAVAGDDLVYETMTISPNQLAQMTLGSARNAWEVVYIQMPGQREWKLALRLRHALEADARRAANRSAKPVPVPAAVPQQASPLPALPRNLPVGNLLAPQLRSDCEERRKVYRRAEDLLLD
ncbi:MULTISPECIES: hypothetical protein [unclassified Duganella]|uniref:hypothetical protein n=1 Tax=unclassified Duganella TaxID=2636909 RepID=UPI0006FAAEB1|nr:MULTISPECIES: hypothetical protein [unclassified Duganella]KQV47706.1 hypothetical protein ASD07_12330 [Duganella sp. Root336D2]KRB82006.1 hypothetical protein ASE26_13945 [Duganella sp. Root198D2]